MPIRFPLRSAALLALLASPLLSASAQRRPGVGMGFYTTTGLLTGDIEAGSVNSTTALAEVPSFALSVLVTAPVKRAAKRAWIVGLRAQAIGLGNGNSCFVTPDITGCQDVRFTDRATLLAGGAFDIRESVLRVMVGPSLYSVQGTGARIGTTVRLDLGSPRLRGSTPTLFVSRTFLGSQRGEALGITSLGAGFRWVRKK